MGTDRVAAIVVGQSVVLVNSCGVDQRLLDLLMSVQSPDLLSRMKQRHNCCRFAVSALDRVALEEIAGAACQCPIVFAVCAVMSGA
jgi:hypothetical protein